MERLWAPRRKAYITRKQSKKCIFCGARRAEGDRVLKRSAHSFSLLNLFPYNPGHLLVAPKRHVSSLTHLRDSELLDLFRLVNETTKRVQKVLKPSGINIGLNLGRSAGAGIPGHVHVHIVPRWNGDANFMPVIAQTKVISESLRSIYRKLAGGR